MGARPMARVIQEHVKRPLAEELLFGKLSNGGQALVRLAADGSGLAIEYVPAPEPEVHA
jgi:ATP-dependent Clp protease ATP-binding subunit ClpA